MELMGRGGDGASGRRPCSPCLYQSSRPCLPVADSRPFIYLYLFQIYGVVKVVSIHKSKRFGIKELISVFFVGVKF